MLARTGHNKKRNGQTCHYLPCSSFTLPSNSGFCRILACERLERLFFSLDFSKIAETDSNVRHAIKILKSTTDRILFGDSLKEELVGILKDLFQMDGGTLWRVGLVSAEQQYHMTLWILDKLDQMTLN